MTALRPMQVSDASTPAAVHLSCDARAPTATNLFPTRARVAELADALDLGSSGIPWGFESPLSHSMSCDMGAHLRPLQGRWIQFP